MEIKPLNPKGNQSWIFIRRNDVEVQAPIIWPPDAKSRLIRKDPDAWKDRRWEEKGTTEDKIVGWHHRLNGHEFEQALRDGDGQGSLLCCSPWGHKESDMTEQLKHFHSIQVIWALPVFLLASLIASLTTWWIWSSGAYMLFLQILAHQQVLLLFSHSVMFESLQPHGLSITGSPVLHYLPEFAQTHVHWVCDAIQPSHSLLPSSPPTFNLSQH